MIIMPSEIFNLNSPDPDFQLEYNAAREIFRVCLFDHDEFVGRSSLVSNIQYPQASRRSKAALRSWMLNKEQYTDIYNRLRRGNIDLVNTPEQYINCHHYPAVYEIIKEWAPKSTWFTEITNEEIIKHRQIIDNDLIIKDFVKSEKGMSDIFILKKELSDEEFIERVHRFIQVRGKLFAEGIVFKEVNKLKLYHDVANEWRIFVSRGQCISIQPNSTDPNMIRYQDGFINHNIIDRIKEKINSNFYTIDVAEKADGSMLILEIGDGQVSGLAPLEQQNRFYSNIYL